LTFGGTLTHVKGRRLK